MKKLKLLVWACLAVVSFGQLAGAQEARIRKTAAANATSSDRGRDGLNGPVRRVRVETAKIVVKDGKPIEGSRVVQGATTYDISGRMIDTVARPVESSAPAGKQQYSYDDKGNITEMVVRGDDGSILSKETYQYEFDELGNWKKMTTSVAIYEDGKLSFEPVEVTYRTISYFYSQAVDKMTPASASKPSSVSAPPAGPVPAKKTSDPQTAGDATARESKTVNNENAAAAGGGTDGNESGNKNPAPPAVSSAPEDGTSARNTSTKSAETPPASTEVPSVPAAKTPVLHVSEEALRSAAINLPPAELPSAAELTGQKGRVEVQVIVNQKGEVIGARGTSDNSLLNEAAEAAAVKARFSPDKLSPDPAIVSGVITYDFVTPSKEIPVVAPATGTANENTRATEPNGGASQPKPDTVASSGTNSAAVAPGAASTEDAAHFYREGLSHLRAGQYTEAVNDLRQAVYLNPEDALAYAKLGVAYASLRQYKETVTVLKLAIRIKAQVVDAEAYYRLGEAYSVLGKHSEALRAFKQAMFIARAQALESDPSKYSGLPPLADLHYGIGLAHNNLGSFNEALKEFKQAIDLKPEFAEAYYGMAIAHIGLDDRKSAEKEEKTLRRLNPGLADKIAAAINTSPASLPGVTNGRRRP